MLTECSKHHLGHLAADIYTRLYHRLQVCYKAACTGIVDDCHDSGPAQSIDRRLPGLLTAFLHYDICTSYRDHDFLCIRLELASCSLAMFARMCLSNLLTSLCSKSDIPFTAMRFTYCMSGSTRENSFCPLAVRYISVFRESSSIANPVDEAGLF